MSVKGKGIWPTKVPLAETIAGFKNPTIQKVPMQRQILSGKS
jgi:hypothetical protein